MQPITTVQSLETLCDAALDWLVGNGADKSHLEWRGYGESEPVANNETEEGRQENRRVEFRIVDMEKHACSR